MTKYTKYNSYLEDLIEKSNLNKKDIHDIREIFYAVDDDKKQNILDNWDYLVAKLEQIEKDFIKEQEILLEKSLDGMDKAIEKAVWVGVASWTHNELEHLKHNI